MLGLIVAMLAASFADAVLTIHLLGIGWYEANPVMAVTAVKATGSDVQAASSTPVAAG